MWYEGSEYVLALFVGHFLSWLPPKTYLKIQQFY
jgi:hypothetical protein